jgi:glycolate oxidase FAD binding subunit
VDQPTCRIDDFGPLPVVQAASVADVADVVRRAAAEGSAVYPVGGQTMLGLGLPPTRPGVAVDLRGLNQVIDYPARDMTITVQAGITMAKLQELLAAEHQWLPIDVPEAERATLGGTVATNVSGARRYGHGTLRDYVLGISVVNDEGQEVKAGGRVVKNVAGYDLMKLYIGSLGTLGIITQVTLKVKPVPEARAMLETGCSADALAELLNRVHASATRPVFINVTTAEPVLPVFWVHVGFEGNRTAVAWQAAKLQEELSPDYPSQVCDGEGTVRLFEERPSELGGIMDGPTSRLTFKANLLPSAVAPFLQAACARHCWSLVAHAGSGIVIGHVTGDLTLDRARTMLMELQEAAAAGQGNLILPRCPPEWKKDLPVWGRPRGDGWLMRAVKDRLDPKGLFNPGRFVEGI